MIAILNILSNCNSVPLDAAVYADTTALFEMSMARDARNSQEPYTQFALRLAGTRVPLVVTNIGLQELRRVIIVNLYKKVAASRNLAKHKWEIVHKQDKALLTQAKATADRWVAYLRADPSIAEIQVDQDAAFIARQEAVMFDPLIGLDQMDAAHYVAAERIGCSALLTNDEGFGLAAENMNVYTANLRLLVVSGSRYSKNVLLS